MDESEYRFVDVSQEWLAGRMGSGPARDLAAEFAGDGWQVIATIAPGDGGPVRVVFQRSP